METGNIPIELLFPKPVLSELCYTLSLEYIHVKSSTFHNVELSENNLVVQKWLVQIWALPYLHLGKLHFPHGMV